VIMRPAHSRKPEWVVSVRVVGTLARQSPPMSVILSALSMSSCQIGSPPFHLSSRTAVGDLPPVQRSPTQERFLGCGLEMTEGMECCRSDS